MVLNDFARWMYRGRRPNWLARVLNQIWAAIGTTGIAANYMVTLEVAGRSSGRRISLPVVVAIVDGQRYLVSMLGERAEWVRNGRADGGRAVIRSGRREDVTLVDVPVDQRAPILKDYLQRAPGARPHMPVDKDAPLAAFARIAADFPVFRVVATAPTPASLAAKST